MSTPQVAHEPERRRYTIAVDGRRVGLAAYREHDGEIDVLHTEVDPTLQGQGLAALLTRFLLEDARVRGVAVIPSCPYTRSYIVRHREYADLVPAERRARLGL